MYLFSNLLVHYSYLLFLFHSKGQFSGPGASSCVMCSAWRVELSKCVSSSASCMAKHNSYLASFKLLCNESCQSNSCPVPTYTPTFYPSTAYPSSAPSKQPSTQPSTQPSMQPTLQPSKQPTSQPSMLPSGIDYNLTILLIIIYVTGLILYSDSIDNCFYYVL
jgi:hypothetical protein